MTTPLCVKRPYDRQPCITYFWPDLHCWCFHRRQFLHVDKTLSMLPLLPSFPFRYDVDVAKTAIFFQETLGFCPNGVLIFRRRSGIAEALIALNRAVVTSTNKGCNNCFKAFY